MRAYGAKVTLTPAEEAMEGARDYAEAEFAKGDCVMLNQFANPDNPLAHYETTGKTFAGVTLPCSISRTLIVLRSEGGVTVRVLSAELTSSTVVLVRVLARNAF